MTPLGNPGKRGLWASARPVGLLLLPVALLVLVTWLGALGAPAGDRGDVEVRVPSLAFGEAFASSGRVELEEPDSALVSNIDNLDVARDGRLAVADQQTDRVRVYGPDGRLLANLGGGGRGPGELDNPIDVAFGGEGGLWVVQQGEGRVTRFDEEFTYDTAFRAEGASYPYGVEPVGDRVVVNVLREDRAGARTLRIYDRSGRVEKAFHSRRREYREVPYWGAAARGFLAVSENHVVAGGNLLYPLALYDRDGTFRDSIGHAPPSWIQPPKPEPGAIMPPNQLRKFEEWRRTFTTIHDLAIYRDSLLVVAHEQLDPEILAYEDATYRADVYEIATRRKVVEDVVLPGRLLDGGRQIHLLVSSPPGPWVVERFRLDPGVLGP